LTTSQMGQYSAPIGANINIVPGINPAFTQFVLAGNVSVANFAGVTINLNSNTVTGQRFSAGSGAALATGLGAGSLTYFPGSTAGSAAAGSTYDAVAGSIFAGAVQGTTFASTTTGSGSITSAGGFTAQDVSSSSNALKMTTSIAIGASTNGIACPAATSGLMMVSDVSVSGVGALFFITGAGSIQLLTTGSLWTNTTTPAASHFGFAFDGTNFRIYNGFASPVNFRALSISVA
jgi:hypothetical protein